MPKNHARVENGHDKYGWLIPNWPAPENVRAVFTTRNGGLSPAPFQSLNFGIQSGDEVGNVHHNRALLAQAIQARPLWLSQIHGTRVVCADDYMARVPALTQVNLKNGAQNFPLIEADASFATQPQLACVALAADCLPVLLCNRTGTMVAAAHAGWRGLAGGVLQNTVLAMQAAGGADCAAQNLMACLGPAIGPTQFEVGQDVVDVFAEQLNEQEMRHAFQLRSAYQQNDEKNMTTAPFSESLFASSLTSSITSPLKQSEFNASMHSQKYLANIYVIARILLARVGVTAVFGEPLCTVENPQLFYSHRREKMTGRMAGVVWLEQKNA